MLGYKCDGCGKFDAGNNSQKDGRNPPEGWATVTGLTPHVGHLCVTCKTNIGGAIQQPSE